MLEGAGHTPIAAAGGRAALELLDDGCVDIDVVLTDVVMPGVSGADVADAVRRRRPNARLLFMSGYAPTTLTSDPRLADAPLLRKPFDNATLLREVAKLLDAVNAS